MENKYSLEQIRRAMDSKNHKFFEKGAYNVNIIGIRNSATAGKVTNKFDDTLTISFKDEEDKWIYHEFDCTTDPGKFYMEDPIVDEKGTAILKPGQYPKSHKIICFGRRGHLSHHTFSQNCIEIYEINKDKWELVTSAWDKTTGNRLRRRVKQNFAFIK